MKSVAPGLSSLANARPSTPQVIVEDVSEVEEDDDDVLAMTTDF